MLSEIEQRVAREIEKRRTALADDLRLHVGIPTGMGYEPGLQETRDRFAARLRALGASVETVPGIARPAWLDENSPDVRQETARPVGATAPVTVVCRRAGNGAAGKNDRPGARVLIAGHLDTVHPPPGRDGFERFNRLSVDPSGKTATGPGCVDMKGGLVIALAALESLEEVGASCAWTFLMNSDEETGSYHSTPALTAEAATHDVGLALEPAMAKGELAIERGGSGQFMIEAHGKAAHVGRDFASGVSAVRALAQAIVRVTDLSDAARGLAVNVGPVKGGTATNVVPEHAACWGNVRFRDESGAAYLRAGLEAASTSGAANEPDGRGPVAGTPRVVVRHSFNRPAKPLTPDTEQLANLARECAADLGQQLPFGRTGGVCDGNTLQAGGLTTIDTLGVRGGGLHTPQEWIEMASLVERCQLLGLLLVRLSSGSWTARAPRR